MSLCQLASEYRGKLPFGGAMVETKHNGFRCLFLRDVRGTPGLWTRQGMPINGCEHILRQLKRVDAAAGEPQFIDGELIVEGVMNEATLAATKRWVESGWRHGEDRGTFHAFDMLPDAEWRAGGSARPLYKRKEALAVAIGLAERERYSWEWAEGTRGRDELDPSPVELVEDEWATDEGELLDLARRVWAIDGEGVVAKVADAPYRRLRSADWMKVKHAGQFKLAA